VGVVRTENLKNPIGITQAAGFPSFPENWTFEPESFVSSDEKLKLFGMFMKKKPLEISGADSCPKNVLVVVHGFGEHGGRYLHFPHYLENAVDGIYVYDQLGHGRSEGARGDAPDFDRYVQDLARVLMRLYDRSPTTRFHLLGHSMGGHIALRFMYLHPTFQLKTVQISAPWLKLVKNPSLPLRGVAKFLAYTYGTLSLAAEIDPMVLSRDENVVEHYRADRLNHSKMTPRLFDSVQKAIKDTLSRVEKSSEKLNYPIQFIIPGADTLIDSKTSTDFFEKLSAVEKKLVVLNEFRHESMNDLGKEKFFDAVSAWIVGHESISSVIQ